jgi:hypothetical protein
MTNKNAAFDDPLIMHVISEVLECAVAEQENTDSWVGNRQLNQQTPKI